jgi:hypothetical protein
VAQSVETWAIALTSCINCEVSGCYWTQCNRAGYGYGCTVEDACQNIDVHDNFGSYNRHTIAVGGNPAANFGIPRGVNIHDNHSEDCYAGNYNCHNVGEAINICDNVALNGYAGINAYQYSGTISGNTIIGCHYGIEFDCSQGDGVTVTGNTIKGATTGIVSYTANARKDLFMGNHVLDATGWAVDFRSNSGGLRAFDNVFYGTSGGIYLGSGGTLSTNTEIKNNLLKDVWTADGV